MVMTKYTWPSKLTEDTLLDCGWTEDRRVDMSETINTLESAGFTFTREGIEILESFGDLWIYPPDIETAQWAGEPFQFDPVGQFEDLPEYYADLQDRLGQRLSPLGRSGGELGLAILDNGYLIGDWTAGVYLFGRTFTEGLDLIIRRYQTPEWLLKY